MAAGALIQIVTSKGSPDLYLTLNPQMSFFRTIYKRHTSYAIETVQIEFDSVPNFGKQVKAKLAKYGDLISKIYLRIKLDGINGQNRKSFEKEYDDVNNEHTDCYCENCIKKQQKNKLNYGWVNCLGHIILNSMFIEIGGQQIDKQYGEWLEIWSELTIPLSKKQAYYEMIGKVDQHAFTIDTFTNNMDLYVPLQFWFCKDYSLALPIIALDYHEVNIGINFRNFNDCWISAKNVPDPECPKFNAYLLVDYIFIDIDEREYFMSSTHTYIIEQLQVNENIMVSSKNNVINFYLNYPVKELIWVLQRSDINLTKDWYNFGQYLDRTNNINDTMKRCQLLLNGQERMRNMPAKYYRLIQPFNCHTNVPNNFIYLYSFSINPESMIPSGSLNFSKITESKFNLKINKSNVDYFLKVYATNYNVLLITSGMGMILFYS